MKTFSAIELFVQNNSNYLEFIKRKIMYRWVFLVNPKLRKCYNKSQTASNSVEKNLFCTQALNAYHEMFVWRFAVWFRFAFQDFKLFWRQLGRRKTIDKSSKEKQDYYSIAVIVKNEATYIREFILFYQVTGADRIYLYDNDSDDNLLEVIEPFVNSGYVVYRKWPGKKVHTAAYRDAVRRTRKRTKWLALVDADEFLFSPKGKTPEQLQNYEEFPGLGVNWVMFGPNGHKVRPTGLVMDNYLTTPEDKDVQANCHTKSIVQPKEVFCICHVHFALYKNGRYAVDTCKNPIDNFCAYIERAGRVFTPKNYRDVLRINHYNTKSLEEFRVKMARGYADGSPNADYNKKMRVYEVPLVEDYEIKPFANFVREQINERSCK